MARDEEVSGKSRGGSQGTKYRRGYRVVGTLCHVASSRHRQAVYWRWAKPYWQRAGYLGLQPRWAVWGARVPWTQWAGCRVLRDYLWPLMESTPKARVQLMPRALAAAPEFRSSSMAGFQPHRGGGWGVPLHKANTLSHCSLLPICMWLLCVAARWSRAAAL